MFPIILTLAFLVSLYFAIREKTRSEGMVALAIIFGIISFLSWVFIPVMHSTILDEIQSYNEEKIMVQNLNLKNLSDLRKAKILESLISQDRKMRYYKKNYDGFWFGIYIPNEECKNIELMKGW